MDQNSNLTGLPKTGVAKDKAGNEENSSGVSWSAVIGGGFVTAALSLILLALGAGLGLSSISPWSNVGASAATLGRDAIVWVILMQVMSCSMGGYLAGRLRTKWANIHNDEVYFRDTVHGFLSWAVALVITTGFLTSAAASMAGATATSAESRGMPGIQAEQGALDLNGYYVDSLFRSDSAKQSLDVTPVRGEAGRIFATSLRRKEIPAEDKNYLSRLVAARTGLSLAEAGSRVTQVFTSAQQDEDTARKTAAHSLLWLFTALLSGAFCASFAATICGRQRDNVIIV